MILSATSVELMAASAKATFELFVKIQIQKINSLYLLLVPRENRMYDPQQ
jgi:hypothetical protein